MHFKARAYRLLGSSCLSLVIPLLAAGPGCTGMDEGAGASPEEEAPGEEAPGEEAPGEEAPGEEEAPGQEETPGQDEEAPDQDEEAPDQDEEAPGQEDGVPADLELCAVPGTLAYHLTQASASGRFDYDPPGGLVTRVRGFYGDSTWRFHWKERFVAGSYLGQRVVRGQAAAFDTDQILGYEIETVDVLGAVSVTEVEESWDGCTVERRFRAEGATDWRSHSGSYDGSTYTYYEEQVPYRNADRLGLVTVYGERYEDQAFIEYVEDSGYPDYYQTRTGDGLGNENLSWEINYGDGYIVGSVETLASGTRYHFTRSLSDGDGCTETWRDLAVAYDGDGSGTSQICDFSNDEYGQAVGCTLDVTPAQCVETCDNGAVHVFPSCL